MRFNIVKYPKKILTVFIMILLPDICESQSSQNYMPPVFADKQRLEKLTTVFPIADNIYKTFVQTHHIPGYAFGIMLDGRLVYAGTGGYADIARKTPITTQSMFRIASMTKSFTAMAILSLRDAGKLRLDDPVEFYIPEMKDKVLTNDSQPITIRDLLTHSSGLPQDDPWGDRKLAETNDNLIAMLKKGIVFSNATGTHYEYSNLAFVLLGYVINKVSGMSYQDYIRTHIWQHLNMQQAAWEYKTIPTTQLVHGYKWVNNHWQEQPLLPDGAFGAMGGMITSMESFSHYVALHQLAWPARNDEETGPIARSSIREMQQPWRFNQLITNHQSILSTAYGYGLRWSIDGNNRISVGHSGGLPGFGSNWTIMPDYGIGVIFFANNTYAPAEAVNREVLATLIQQAHLTTRTLPISTILQEKQQALVGLLMDWKENAAHEIFAPNFFLDHDVARFKHEIQTSLNNIGKIKRVSEIIPENQLRGKFNIEGENGILKIHFTLMPQEPPLIQDLKIEHS